MQCGILSYKTIWMKEKMKIAVTASNGQLDSSIVNELKSIIGDLNVIGVVRTPEKASHLGIELRKEIMIVEKILMKP